MTDLGSTLPDPAAIDDVLAVQDDVAPLDRADVFEHRDIDAIGFGVTESKGSGHLLGLPVDDAGDDEGQAAAAVLLGPEFACVALPAAAVEDVSR